MRRADLITVFSFSLLYGGQVLAQPDEGFLLDPVAQADEAQALASSEEDSVAGSSPGVIEEIVVTARRKEERLSETPLSIVALDQAELESRGISSAFDLNSAVPGLNVTNVGYAPTFSIRGRGQTYGTASGSVETYFADVPLSAPPNSPTLPPPLFDLASVQVLKGPQGTLFGRNSTGGAVLLTPVAPGSEFGGYARGQLGDYGNVQFEGAVDVPVSENVKMRFAAFHWRRDGYNETIGGAVDPTTGRTLPEQTFSNQDVTEARATLLLTPIDGVTNSTVLSYHTDENRVSSKAIALRNPEDVYSPIPIEVLYPEAAATHVSSTDVDLRRPASDILAAVNTTTVELTDWLSVKNIFGYIDSKGYYGSPVDTDGFASADFAINGLLPPQRLENRQLTNEVQFAGSIVDDRLDFLVGAMYDSERQPGGREEINLQVINYLNSPAGEGYDHRFVQANITSRSAFGSATWAFTPDLKFTLGARRILDEVDNKVYAYAAQTYEQVPDLSREAIERDGKFSGWAYNAGLDYQWDTSTLFYGGYRRGYKRGGINNTPTTPEELFYKPEKVDDLYLGLKKGFDLLGAPAQVNVEGFYDVYKDAQRSNTKIDTATTPASIVNVTSNAEKLIYRGFDGDFSISPSGWLTLQGRYSFIDAYYKKYSDRSIAGMDGDLSVNPVSDVAKHKLSLSARLRHEEPRLGEFVFIPTYSYQSKVFMSDNAKRLANSEALVLNGGEQVDQTRIPGTDTLIPSYGLLDLRLEWNRIAQSRLDVALSVRNATDEQYRQFGSYLYLYGAANVLYGPPRMITFDIKTTF